MQNFSIQFARSWGVAVLVTVMAMSVAVPLPATAEVAVPCDHDWEEVALLIRRERRQGVTPEWLDEINELVPVLMACGTDADGVGSNVERWAPLVASYFRPEDVERVMCLMQLESRGDPSAVNPTSGATGLMQVMPFWARRFGHTRADLKDPLVNLDISAWILDQHGWTSWSPYKRGSCR